MKSRTLIVIISVIWVVNIGLCGTYFYILNLNHQMAAIDGIVVEDQVYDGPRRPTFIPGGNVSADGPINSIPTRPRKKDFHPRSILIANLN